MKLIVSFLFYILFCISAFSQTTEEEYNYITKVYKIQIESGLDMKKGYRFEEIAEHYTTNNTNVRRTCKFLALYRLGQLKPCAVLCIYTRSDNGFKDYICIPTYDAPQYLWNAMYKQLDTYEGEGAQSIMWGMSKLAAYFAKN